MGRPQGGGYWAYVSWLHWDPAPLKLDVAPAKVKDVLFPDYQRATAGPQVTVGGQEGVEEGGRYGADESHINWDPPPLNWMLPYPRSRMFCSRTIKRQSYDNS